MATLTLLPKEIEALEEQLQAKTHLPWKFTDCQCASPDFIPIFCFSYEIESGPEDQEAYSKVRVIAQSDINNGLMNLYGVRFEGDAIEALQVLDMMHQ